MPARKAGLGRGLDALIPTEAPKEEREFVRVAVDEIQPNPEQPRSRFDDESLGELTASIEEVGVLQPVVVRRSEQGYVLVAGERRWRAAKKAGLDSIPAVVRESSGDSALVEALIENVQRQDLTPLEEAHAYKQLLEEYGMTQESVARRVGKSRPAVSNTLRLLQLPGAIQAMVDSGALSAGHARALLGLEDERFALYLAERAVAEGWSVRQIEDAAKERKPQKKARTRVTEIRPVEIVELEKRLTDHIGAKVKINYRNQKGKIEIRFGSVAELERIYRVIS
ncbi:MAG: ParB/RepB/Spo0J family partition protein [Acidimicrobiia bacterium]